MNCEKFERVVTDIARGQLTQAGLREEAILHTQACKVCAASFAQAQNLSVALRALALLDENKKADHQVEANLLTAFRNPVAKPATVASVQPATATRNHRVYWWAAAAVIIIALALFALLARNYKPMLQQEARDNRVELNQQNPKNEIVNPDDKLRTDKNPTARGTVTGKKSVENNRRNLIHQTAKLNPRLAKNESQQNRAGLDGKPAEEIATNFIPLYNIPMTEGGQLVRVQLPRSALATFGLPVNAALADKPIKADVVIGNDGIARAIRFVQ